MQQVKATGKADDKTRWAIQQIEKHHGSQVPAGIGESMTWPRFDGSDWQCSTCGYRQGNAWNCQNRHCGARRSFNSGGQGSYNSETWQYDTGKGKRPTTPRGKGGKEKGGKGEKKGDKEKDRRQEGEEGKEEDKSRPASRSASATRTTSLRNIQAVIREERENAPPHLQSQLDEAAEAIQEQLHADQPTHVRVQKLSASVEHYKDRRMQQQKWLVQLKEEMQAKVAKQEEAIRKTAELLDARVQLVANLKVKMEEEGKAKEEGEKQTKEKAEAEAKERKKEEDEEKAKEATRSKEKETEKEKEDERKEAATAAAPSMEATSTAQQDFFNDMKQQQKDTQQMLWNMSQQLREQQHTLARQQKDMFTLYTQGEEEKANQQARWKTLELVLESESAKTVEEKRQALDAAQAEAVQKKSQEEKEATSEKEKRKKEERGLQEAKEEQEKRDEEEEKERRAEGERIQREDMAKMQRLAEEKTKAEAVAAEEKTRRAADAERAKERSKEDARKAEAKATKKADTAVAAALKQVTKVLPTGLLGKVQESMRLNTPRGEGEKRPPKTPEREGQPSGTGASPEQRQQKKRAQEEQQQAEAMKIDDEDDELVEITGITPATLPPTREVREVARSSLPFRVTPAQEH